MIRIAEIKRERRLIDMAPLVDLVFLLLIFFMVGSRFAEPALDLVLPEAQSGANQNERGLLISVTRDGRIFLNGSVLPLDDLPERLGQELKKIPDRSVTLRADGEIPFRDFVRLMDEVRLAGAKSLHIEHRNAAPRTASL